MNFISNKKSTPRRDYRTSISPLLLQLMTSDINYNDYVYFTEPKVTLLHMVYKSMLTALKYFPLSSFYTFISILTIHIVLAW